LNQVGRKHVSATEGKQVNYRSLSTGAIT